MSSRFDYVKYDMISQATQEQFKLSYEKLCASVDLLPIGRAKDLAVTKLEESYMWIGKALRDDQIVRNGSAELQESLEY